METSMIVADSYPVAALQFGLSSDVKESAQWPKCDGINHIYLPQCELSILVRRPSRKYMSMAHMCPCGKVSFDHGKTWEQLCWSLEPCVDRAEPVSTVTNVEMTPDATIAPNNITAQRRVKLATLTSFAMLASGFFMGIILNFLLVGIFATLASPHVWWWAKVRAPQWWAMLVKIAFATPGFVGRLVLVICFAIDMWVSQSAIALKYWLLDRPAAIEEWSFLLGVRAIVALLRFEEQVLVVWANRPRVLRANLSGYAFAIFVIATMLAAGIR